MYKDLLDTVSPNDLTPEDFETVMNVALGDALWAGHIPGKDGFFWAPATFDADCLTLPGWDAGMHATEDNVVGMTRYFAEMDEGTIDEQLARVDAAVAQGMPHPTAVVLSGDPRVEDMTPGKSVHLFWQIDGSSYDSDAGFAGWRVVQQALADALQGDPKIKNLSRRMRWGGAVDGTRHQTFLDASPSTTKDAMEAWAQTIRPSASGTASKLLQGIARAVVKRPPETLPGTQQVTDTLQQRTIEEWHDDDSVPMGSHWNICCPIAGSKTPGSAFLVKEDYGVRMVCNAQHHDHAHADSTGISRWIWYDAFVFQRGDEVEVAERIYRTDLHGAAAWAEGNGYLLDAQTSVWEGATDSDDERIFNLTTNYAGHPVVVARGGTRPLKVSSTFAKGVANIFWQRNKRHDFFSSAPDGVACNNGFLTADGDIQPLSAKHRVRSKHVFPVAYKKDATCRLWHTFLDQVFDDDTDKPEKIRVLQEYIGACLFQKTTLYQRHIILYGASGANGKSVIIRVIGDLFPQGSVATVPMQQWSTSFGLWWVPDALINLTSEMPERDLLDSGPVKAVLAGEDVEINRKNKANFQATPRAGHVFAANSLPALSDRSGGFFRRFIVLGFNRSFTPDEQDPLLPIKLSKEREGIFSWGVEGYKRLLKRRQYILPASHSDEIRRWRAASDSVAAFADAHLDPSISNIIGTTPLYEVYAAWAQGFGRRPVSHTKFSLEMTRLRFDRLRSNEARGWGAVLKCKEDLPRDALAAAYRNRSKVLFIEDYPKVAADS